MINWSALVAKFISMLMSWADASNLRNRLYKLEEENEIMRTALDDIRRMDVEGRIGWLAKRTLDQIEGRE
jgi:hypothetical protein